MSDNVEKLRRANDELLTAGNDYSDTLLDAAIEIDRLRKALMSSCDEQRQLFRDEANFPCEAAIENQVLRDLLSEIWRHRNGGSALPSSWDRRVTEVLDGNGPA